MLRVLSVVATELRVYLRRSSRKRAGAVVFAGLALVVAAAGCGGGKTVTQGQAGQAVGGRGFTFQAPADWTVTVDPRESLAKRDATTLVSVTRLPLVKTYRPNRFQQVVPELDRVATTLAKRLGGRVTSKRTTTVAGRQVRAYELVHDDLVDRLAFVLRGKDEFLLTCRWRSSEGEPAACGQLTSSFRLT